MGDDDRIAKIAFAAELKTADEEIDAGGVTTIRDISPYKATQQTL